MRFTAKTFEELTTDELYELLRVRTAVFVVEQDCPYQEVDGEDKEALHVWLADEEGTMYAYLRAFPREDGSIQMGRVLTMDRGTGLGKELLDAGIPAVLSHFDTDYIFIEAQVYATGFYEPYGFVICGEEFLEDGIPHIPMELKQKA